jgi:hypothetical protein
MQRDVLQLLILALAAAIVLLALGVSGTPDRKPAPAALLPGVTSRASSTSTATTTATTAADGAPTSTPVTRDTPSALSSVGIGTPSSSFLYSFNSPGILQESSSMDDSSSPYLWLNSGGELIIADGYGETMQGDTSAQNIWRGNYAASNPTDSDGGAHPQNILRLVTRSQWRDLREDAQFLVVADNFSKSFNRNTSNGLLLMSRYARGGQTLYYAGIRVDGTAVIKKKIHGVYYTMAQEQVFPGTYTGWQDDVNLIPHHEWIGLRSDTVTNSDGSVTIRLYIQRGGSQWVELLHATDNGQYGGTPPISGQAYAGIRTDFMDVQFKQYDLQEL